MLVTVPEGSEVDGKVEVLPFQGISAAQGYLPSASPAPTPLDAVQQSVHSPVVQRPLEATVGAVRDLRPFKKSMVRLPINHPLRFALQGEPDWMAPAELRLKLREWAKYLAWQER